MLVPAPTTRMRHRTSSRWCEKRAFGRTSRQFRSLLHTLGSLASTSKARKIEANSILATQSRFAESNNTWVSTSPVFPGWLQKLRKNKPRTSEDNAAQGEGAECNASVFDEAESTVRTRKPSVCEVGRMLHESCQIKRPLTQKITNSNIDEIYNLGPSSGALGGTAGGRAAADSSCSWYRRSGIGRPRLAEESAVWGFLFFNKGSHGAVYEPEAPAQERSPIYA